MSPHRIPNRSRRRAGLGVAVGAVLAGMVSAQPAPPTAPGPAPSASVPDGPVPEQAPPATVANPAPVATPPPVTAKDVAPAAAPKEQVAEKPVEVVVRRARYDIAVLQALDKVTAETLRFEAEVGRPVRWKGLVFTVRACERSAPNEPIDDSMVYLTIDSQPRPQPGRPSPPPREAFKGWMFASSPGLNPVQHATYDAWAISCRTNAPPSPVVAAPASALVAKPPVVAKARPVVSPPPARVVAEPAPGPTEPAAPVAP